MKFKSMIVSSLNPGLSNIITSDISLKVHILIGINDQVDCLRESNKVVESKSTCLFQRYS